MDKKHPCMKSHGHEQVEDYQPVDDGLPRPPEFHLPGEYDQACRAIGSQYHHDPVRQVRHVLPPELDAKPHNVEDRPSSVEGRDDAAESATQVAAEHTGR